MSGADGLFFDEEKFLIGLPFEVIHTAVPGAYDIPAPPQGFDPNTASAEERRRYGMVWRRSVAKRHAPTRALWEKLSARSFTPVFDSAAPTPRVTVPRRRPRLPDMGDVDTTWGGAALTSGSWTGVWGQWVIPDRGLSHTVLDTNQRRAPTEARRFVRSAGRMRFLRRDPGLSSLERPGRTSWDHCTRAERSAPC